MFTHSNNMKVNKPSEIKDLIDEESIVYIASRDYKDEILVEASDLGFKQALIFGSKLSVMEI